MMYDGPPMRVALFRVIGPPDRPMQRLFERGGALREDLGNGRTRGEEHAQCGAPPMVVARPSWAGWESSPNNHINARRSRACFPAEKQNRRRPSRSAAAR